MANDFALAAPLATSDKSTDRKPRQRARLAQLQSIVINRSALDKKLFDAYNTCDLATMGDLVTDDLEFYHDKTGLSVGKQVFLDAIKNNICGKTQRQLVPGSMEVSRLDHYGAVEMGLHRFTHPGHEEWGVGEAKFITLWRLKDGKWQITRDISYDRESAKQPTSNK